MRKNLGFTTTAVLLLTLGLGASVAIFAFVDAALIKPLPFQNPNRLMGVFEETGLCPRCNVSYLNFQDWKNSDLPFSSLEAWRFSTYLLPASSGAQPVSGARVTDGFVRTLGVTPMLGRDFYPGEDKPGQPQAVLLSFAAWRSRFGGAASIVGRTIRLSDDAYTVIGVLPLEFHFAPRDAQFWTTLNDPTSCEKRRSCHSLFGLARLKDGVSVQAARAQMKSLAQKMEKQYPDNRGYSADILPLSEVVTRNVPVLLLLVCGVGLLLLIACVNISSLLLVRSEGRKREVALRGALGASGARLIRQFVTEAAVLVAGGSVFGVATASSAMRLVVRLIPADMLEFMPYLQNLGLNGRILIVAGGISLFAAVLFSIAPILRLSRLDMHADLTKADAPPPAPSGAASVPDSLSWNWPPPWSFWLAQACWARASISCSM